MTFNLVIAGVSRGIGKTLVEQFLQEWKIDRIKLYPGLAQLKRGAFNKIKIIALTGSGRVEPAFSSDADTEIIIQQADFRHPETLKSNLLNHLESIEEIHGIIINSGYFEKAHPQDIDVALLQKIYSINVFGPAILLGSCWKKLSSQGGHIVLIGSMGGVQGSVKFAGLSIYSSSKMALSGLGESLATELPEGWAMNTLALGSVRTEMLREAFPEFTGGIEVTRVSAYIKSFFWTSLGLMNGVTVPVRISNP